MNWDAIGAFGEIFGAVAVVISVIYLATQIKNQTTESRLAGTRELAGKRSDISKLVATDKEMAEQWLRSIRDYDSMTGTERMQASAFFYMIMRGAEVEFIHAGTGQAHDPYLDSADRVLSVTIAYPGLQQWWRTSGDGFTQSFQDHINALIAANPESSTTDAFEP